MNTIEAANPFAMMLAPQQVLQTIEASSALRSLRQKQYMLLDRPGSLAPAAANDPLLDDEDDFDTGTTVIDEPLLSESVGASQTYQSFPRIFN